MSVPDDCPACGETLAPDAPRGLCPRCLLLHGLCSDTADVMSAAIPCSFEPGSLSVLHGLSEEIGPMPRVMLRDEESDNDPAAQGPSSSGRADGSGEAGRYKLFGEIARGGMGAILRGRDTDLGRDLAVKVLLDQHRKRPEFIRRFIEEAQIGGQLQHPGIVPVHELGMLPDQRPYFTMKLVKGHTLAWLLEARRHAGEDLSRFLGIFEQVCQTMAYTHSRGVLHCDLKPGNVMVGSFGEVQVMDWGLASVLGTGRVADSPAAGSVAGNGALATPGRSSAEARRVGPVLGTPAYMAPEQGSGEIDKLDERTDVFGLGSILCEILTGKPPYMGRDSAETRRLAFTADLADAWSRLDCSGAEPSLVALARRCLAPLPGERPRNAGEVAAAITSYLRGVQERLRQVELERVHARTKAAEERTRRRLAMSLAAAVTLLVVTAAGGGTWMAWDHERRAARLELAIREVENLKFKAEVAGTDIASWSAALQAARRVGQLSDDARNGVTRARAAVLVQEVEERAGAAEAEAELLGRLAEIREAMSEMPAAQTDSAYAAAFLSAGLDIDGRPPEESAQAIARRPAHVAGTLAAWVDHWASVRLGRGDCDGAARLAAVARAADPDDWRGRLRAALLKCGKRERLDAIRDLARSAPTSELPPVTLALLGSALLRAGDPAAAEAVLRPAQRRHPGDLWLAIDLAQTLEKLSRRGEAIRYYMMARAVRPESAHSLAHALEAQGESDEAIAVFRELIHASPAVARHHVCLGKLLQIQGLSRQAAEVLDESIVAAREAIRRWPDDSSAHTILGNGLRERGRLDEAVDQYREALRLGPADSNAHFNLGTALYRQGRVDDSFAEWRETIRLQPGDHRPHASLGNALADLGRLDEAENELRATIRLKPDEAAAHFNFGLVLFHQGRSDDAVAEFRAAIRLDPGLADAHNELGAILCDDKGEYDAAIAEFRTAIQLRPDEAGFHLSLGVAFDKQGKPEEAIREYREVIRLQPDFAVAHWYLGHLLRHQGHYAEALTALRSARELGSKLPHWPYPTDEWVRQTQRLVELEAKLPALLRGEVVPENAHERLDLAQIAYARNLHATAVRFAEPALSSEPELVRDVTNTIRYNLACSAALAGCGRGKDQPPTDEAARATLRHQAFDWLEADLEAWSSVVTSGPTEQRSLAQHMLEHWKGDGDLAGVRDPESLARLKVAEQAEWRMLWERVDRLLIKLRAASR